MKKAEQWIALADEDFDAAEAMLAAGKWKYTVFLSQQSLEKFLKALHIQTKNALAPPIHNLFRLAEIIGKERFSESQLRFFSEISVYYLASRYPEDRDKMEEIGNRAKATDVLKTTGEIRQWLKKILS
jgi:HEPN domain-containing protein